MSFASAMRSASSLRGAQRDDRAEDLLAPDRHLGRDVAEHDRRDQPRVAARRGAVQRASRPCAIASSTSVLTFATAVVVDQRAEVDAGVDAAADLELGDRGDELAA